MTKKELLELLNTLGVEYAVAVHHGNLVKINFWVEDEEEIDDGDGYIPYA